MSHRQHRTQYNRPDEDYMEEDDNGWDGIDRRGTGEDRRQIQMPPPMPPYFQQYGYPQMMYPNQQQMPPQPAATGEKDKNVAHTTLTLSQLGVIAIAVLSIIGSVINVWNTMNKQIDDQKNTFEQFKIQITKDLNNMDRTLIDMKKVSEELRTDHKQSYDQLDKRIQDLDSSVSQIYQKVSKQ